MYTLNIKLHSFTFDTHHYMSINSRSQRMYILSFARAYPHIYTQTYTHTLVSIYTNCVVLTLTYSRKCSYIHIE